MRYSGKTVMITGGAQGIGEAAARGFVQEGAAAVIADLDIDRATALAADLGRAIAVEVDVRDRDAIDACVAAADAAFGGVDILINCAALHNFTYGQPTLKLDIAKWRDMLDVNVVGIVNAVAAAQPSMQRRGGGVVVNLASINAYIGLSAYGVSKLAVRGLTSAMAGELAPDNIRVVGIAPGMVDSESVMAELPQHHRDALINQMQLIKRQGRREDIVNAFLFFCSDQASFITGETIIIGGGYPALP
ncbi:SDR family NAD(P)-dependent oxidoreductase [Sphingomonas crocodyli]|uniref:SDR family oxidoreductase n=1 Tax=Sphingomonas crocodyli TaxID=1979270 RepID=A0A437M9W5_9SPHN|nr:SDR family oxidoreductase [Sphingomonas crocodyli]RVT94384.1 SDR family oxidoreductase [Sphingomonas crocodyli]